MRTEIKEAIRLLDWAEKIMEEHGINADNWYGDVLLFVEDVNQRRKERPMNDKTEFDHAMEHLQHIADNLAIGCMQKKTPKTQNAMQQAKAGYEASDAATTELVEALEKTDDFDLNDPMEYCELRDSYIALRDAIKALAKHKEGE